VKQLLIGILGLLLAFAIVAGITATPLVGEVVTLHTRDAAGEWKTTLLWIADAPDGAYLRAGGPETGWLQRLRTDPVGRLERKGELADIRLVPAPTMRQQLNDLMAEKYGWADAFVGMLGNPEGSLPLRVERSAAGS